MSLPAVIVNIIYEYRNQLEWSEKISKVHKEIRHTYIYAQLRLVVYREAQIFLNNVFGG